MAVEDSGGVDTGAVVDVVIDGAGAIGSMTVTSAGTGFAVGDILLLNLTGNNCDNKWQLKLVGSTFDFNVGPNAATANEIGDDALTYKFALEAMKNVDRVEVEKNGDGTSALYSYGYSYTVNFWGRYNTEGIPQIVVDALEQNVDPYTVHVHTVREAEYLGDYSSRHLSLRENHHLAARMRAVNAKGISAAGASVETTTENFGELPGVPENVQLGVYRSSDSLSLTYGRPQLNGGLPVTSYLVETDSSSQFNPDSRPYYQTQTLTNVPEVQQITTYFRGGDNVKTRGGSFELSWGGRTTGALDFDISAFHLEVALNTLLGTRNIAVAPVAVTRVAWSRGYKWTVTFKGIHGDVGTILADDSTLEGDDARMDVLEMTKGNSDIVPDDFTYEVQVVKTSALSTISAGRYLPASC